LTPENTKILVNFLEADVFRYIAVTNKALEDSSITKDEHSRKILMIGRAILHEQEQEQKRHISMNTERVTSKQVDVLNQLDR